MIVREPVVAGQFYPAEAGRCRARVKQLVADASSVPGRVEPLCGGLVPHAGWDYSGATAARVFATLASNRSPDVVVLFGGVHHHLGKQAALFGRGQWATPLGPLEVDQRLAERILGNTNLIVDDPYAHEQEHSIEVQMPFVKHLFPDVKVVPLMVPPTRQAHDVGRAVGRTLESYKYNALVIGTTDLTHYGPSYGFTPKGIGATGNKWAKEVNDWRFLELVLSIKGPEAVPEAREHQNACAAGATAATLAAVSSLGATEGILLEHTSSAEVMASAAHGEVSDSVGYAAVIFS